MSDLEKKSRRIKKVFKEGVDSSVIVDNQGILEMFDNGKWYPVGPGGYTTVTKEEADILITESKLKPFHLYKITGYSKNKITSGSSYNEIIKTYDDGTNSGTTVYLTSDSINSFSRSGHGEFYNAIVKKTDYYTVDRIRSNSSLWGIWDGDNPITGDRPTYSINEEVIWGGYVWKNKTGAIGTRVDDWTLDSTNWEKIQFSNNLCYDKVIDLIEVDYKNDWISRRRMQGIDAYCDILLMWNWYIGINIIAMQPFYLASYFNKYNSENGGYYNADMGSSGPWATISNYTVHGIFNLINFKGINIVDVHIGQDAYSQSSFGSVGEGVYFGFLSSLYNINVDSIGIVGCVFIGQYKESSGFNKRSYITSVGGKNHYFENLYFISTGSSDSGLANMGGDFIQIMSNLSNIIEGKSFNNITSTIPKFTVVSRLNYSASVFAFNSDPKYLILPTTGQPKFLRYNTDGSIVLKNMNE